MDQDNQQTVDQNNLRRILLFLEEHDPLEASWENAEAFLDYLKQTARTSFKMINRKYLERLYEMYREQTTNQSAQENS